MAEHIGWAYLEDRVRVNLFARQKALIQGQAKDWDDYRAKCAWMEGVSFILDLPEVVARELEREILERKAFEEAENEPSDEDDFSFDLHPDL